MRYLIPFLLVLAACSPVATTSHQGEDSATDTVEIPVSLYVVVSDGGFSSTSSSKRTTDELDAIFVKMQEIWDQAGVDLALVTTDVVSAPESVLADLARGNTGSFFDAAAAGVVTIPNPADVVGFYVEAIGSANGMTPLGTRVFFVADDPSVNDERVSSHEIGHILGLSHTLDDSARLMFSGTNGTNLTDEESTVARYGASAILEGVR